MNCDSVFVKNYFTALEKENIKYCILRNADEVENGDAHDVDMTVELRSMRQAFDIMKSVAENLGWKMHMMTGDIRDKINIKCMNFFKVVEGKPILVHFDFFPTSTWSGMVMLDNETLLEGIDCSTIYHKANPAVEAVTKLFIRLLHNNYIKEKYIPFIFEVFQNRKEQVLEIMQNFLSQKMASWVYEAVCDEKWSLIVEKRKEIISDIVETLKRKKNYYPVKLNFYRYIARKLVHKAGPMVVFEGTDGSGKTTIINGLPEVLERTFNGNLIDYYHWRPNFLKSPNPKSNENTGLVCAEPHGKKPYNKVVSFGKFIYFNLDYILGYFFKTRIQQSKGRMVIFDRYYYDYYLDKLRYRLNISDAVLDFFKPFIPKPDVTLLLTGDAQVLYERKREISIEEIQGQIDRMLEKKDCFHNPVVIDVNQPIDAVVNSVAKEILEYAHKRYETI